jgi:hypothetical protein
MAEETKIIRIIVDSSKAVDGSASATRALERMERSTASMDTALARMERSLGTVGLYLKTNLILLATDMASRLFQMGKSALAAAGDMGELAQQMGITVKGLQGLQFAGIQNRISLEQLETGVGKFTQKIGEAAGGSKEMIDSLNDMGVKILDVNGKILPTEKLMQSAAVAILAMSDPATQAAAAVDLFGKAGVKMLPTLKDIAGGFDDMAEKAKRAGAMISQEAIDKLNDLGDAGTRNQFKMRAFFAENAAGPLTETLDFITRKIENLSNILKNAKGDLLSLLSYATNPVGTLASAFGSSPQEKMAADIAKLQGTISTNETTLGGMGPNDARRKYLQGATDKAAAQLSALQRQQGVLAVGGQGPGYLPSDPDGVGIRLPFVSGGVKNPGIKGGGGGGGEADALAKLSRNNARDLDAANAYAEASERGAKAVADLEIHFKALKAAQDAYGKTADQNAGQVATLTVKIEEQMRAIDHAKNIKDFNLGTEELEKANVLLAAENELINANVETRARELALIKLKQEVQSKGLDENNAAEKIAIERRHSAIEQNERLKAQGEELRKANELWTAPLKSALESIQSTAADAFEGMLESGKFSFQALGDVAKKTVIRMIAEFAALAIIRPMMGSLIGGLQGVGLVSGSTASSLGYGGSAGGGSGGGFSMPGLGGGGGLGSMFGFLNNPIMPNAGAATSGASPASGMFPAGASSVGLGGLTWGQGIAGAAGIGFGAYNLATSNSTAGQIGGGLSMLGSGIGLAGAMGMLPMLGAAAGPIGMGIGLIGALLPSLLGGGEEPKLPPLAGANTRIDWSGSGYRVSSAEQNGGQSIGGQGQGMADAMMALFSRAGGTPVAGKVWGNAAWQNYREGTSDAYILDPSGGSTLSHGSETGDNSKWIDQALAYSFRQTAIGGGLEGISPNLITALANNVPASMAEAGQMVDFVKGYDALGEATNSAKDALEKLNTQFADLTTTASRYGLALEPIQDEQKKQTKRSAQDFIDGMLDPLAVQMRAFDDQRKDSLASAEYIRDNVEGVYVDIARITEFWNTKRLDLEAQYQNASVGNLQALIRRLTYGDLANASPDVSYAGTRGTYEATLAQARAGSGSALNNLAGTAEAYAGSARSYFASSAEYAAIVEQIRRDLEGQLSGGSTSPSAANSNAATNASMQQTAELQGMVSVLVSELRDVKDQLAAATAQMQRRG